MSGSGGKRKGGSCPGRSISIRKSKATLQKSRFPYFLLPSRHFTLGDRIIAVMSPTLKTAIKNGVK